MEDIEATTISLGLDQTKNKSDELLATALINKVININIISFFIKCKRDALKEKTHDVNFPLGFAILFDAISNGMTFYICTMYTFKLSIVKPYGDRLILVCDIVSSVHTHEINAQF